MVRKFLEKVFNAFSIEPYRVVLERKGPRFLLSSWRGQERISLSQLPQIDSLYAVFSSIATEQEELVIHPGRLLAVREALSHFSAVRVEISADVASLKSAPVPFSFCLHFSWSGEEEALTSQLPRGTLNLKEGWFLQDDCLFHLEGLLPADEIWLEHDQIKQGPDLLKFLREVLPDWLRRNLPVSSGLQYSEDPAPLFLVERVEDDSVTLNLQMRVPADEAEAISCLPGYLIAQGFLRPGIRPAAAKGGVIVLQGEEIPLFMRDQFPHLRGSVDGKVEELSSKHRLLVEKGELILALCRREEVGIGRTYAVPFFSVEGWSFEAEPLSWRMNQAEDFIRVEEGWIPVENLRQAGIGPGGRTTGMTSLRSFPLTPDEVLRGGGARMEGPWAKRDFPPVSVPDAETEAETSRLHMDFLAFWGLPGGIVGSTKEIAPTLARWLAGFSRRNPGSKLLLVGGNRDLEILRPLIPEVPEGLFLSSPKILEGEPQLLREDWTILVLLQADALLKSATSRLYYCLLQIHKRLAIGTFTSFDFLRRYGSRQALARVFEVSYYSSIWQHTVRNPAFRPPPPPLRYGWASRPVVISPRLAEYTLEREERKSMPIPPRSGETPLRPVTGPETLYAPGTHSFFLDAEKLSAYEEPQAEFVPFQQYYPTYYDMTSEQRKWYFFWRGQVRRGSYLETDLSYIFLHIYELINRVGVGDLMDGYEQLCQIWRNYRGQFPRLDFYLVDWIADYALFYHAPIDPLDIYREALGLGFVPFPDLLLPDYLSGPCDRIPFALWEKLSAYDLRAGSFYAKGGKELCERIIPQAVKLVNRYLVRERGQSLFQRFRPLNSFLIQRRPFEGALFGESRREAITLAAVLPYSQHAPLRDFISAVFKHAENKLREISNFRGRLSGYHLEAKIQALLDEALFRKVTQVTLDEVRVKELIQESDQVRDWLLTPQEEAVAREAASPPSSFSPAEGADPWAQFFSRLTPAQKQALQAIARGEDFSEISCIARENLLMPEALIDSLNELALETIGDFILVPNSAPPSIEEEDEEIVEKWLNVLK